MLYHVVRLCAPHGASQKPKPLRAAPEREQSWGGVSSTTSNPWRVPFFPLRTSVDCEKRLGLMLKKTTAVFRFHQRFFSKVRKSIQMRKLHWNLSCLSHQKSISVDFPPVVTAFHLIWSGKSDPRMHESTQALTKALASRYFKTHVAIFSDNLLQEKCSLSESKQQRRLHVMELTN